MEEAMSVVPMPKQDLSECRFVEVLTTARDGGTFGHKLTGAHSGPNVLVAGHRNLVSGILERLIALPTLPWMRGAITLIILEDLDFESYVQSLRTGPADLFDEILCLPYTADRESTEDAALQGYRTILRQCARLGMIAGRGVNG